MKNHKKHSFLYGSFILIVSVVITKVIGAVFRIPLANLLGGVGMGYYSAAYGVFMPVYAVTAAGLPSAVAKIVAEEAALGHFENLRRIKRTALIAFSGAGAVFTLLSVPASFLFVKLSDNPDALLAVLTILPAIFFGCVACVLRGYFEGLRNMHPTAVSQVLEAVVKLGLGLWLTVTVLKMPYGTFTNLFGESSRLSVAAAAAIAGVTVSTAVSVLYLLIVSAIKSDTPLIEGKSELHEQSAENIVKTSNSHKTHNVLMSTHSVLTRTQSIQRTHSVLTSNRSILKSLLKIAVPIALGALVTNMTTLIDLTTTIPSLKAAIGTSLTPFLPLMHAGVAQSDLAPFIFGSFTGLAVTVFTLLPSATNMFGKTALPLISESAAQSDMNMTARNADKVLTTAALIAVPGGIGISLLAKDILAFLFPARLLEVAVSAEPLSYLGIAVIFLCLSTAVFAVLQAVGRADLPLKYLAVGVVVKLILNLVLVRIPTIGIKGAAISTLVCYVLIFFLSMASFYRLTGVKRGTMRTSLLSVTLAGCLCGIGAMSAKDFLPIENSVILLIVSIGIGGIIYAACLMVLGINWRKLLT